jgi:hypothetical protein
MGTALEVSGASPADVNSRADIPTLAALGVVAFVVQSLLHEAVGHGGACLAAGGTITLLTPMYMRCSVDSLAIVAAGPALNLVAGALAWLALRRLSMRAGTAQWFLWLCLAFNGLVAAGYLLVGAATGFGDWSVLFGSIEPAWHWRVPAGIGAVLALIGMRAIAAREFARLTGIAKPGLATWVRLVGVPTGAAAAVAIAAQACGQGSDPLGLALASGSTLGVGLTLLGIEGPAGDARLHVGRSHAWLVLAALLAAAFVLVIGPGADLSALG